MTPRLLVAAAVLGAGTPVLAAAPDRPPMAPLREASVLYRLTNPGVPSTEVRITTGAGGSPMRIDLPDRTYMLIDGAARNAALVVPDEQMVLDLPFENGPQTQFQLNERMRFTRRGADTVAAVRCTVWDVVLDRARSTVCISEDGVLLRSAGQDEAGRRNLLEAVSVSYAPASPGEFTAPADFEHMAASPDRPAADPAPQ